MAPNEYAKTIVLQMIKEKKDILFGSIPHPLTNEDRHREWQAIHEKAKSLGLVKESKSWEYMRDTTWANWKRRTLEKKDKKGKTGKEGGRVMQYTAIDNLVLDIVGRDSPLLEGLPVPESMMEADEASLLSIPSSPMHQSTPRPNVSSKTVSAGNLKSRPKVMFRLNSIPNLPGTSATSPLVEVQESLENQNAAVNSSTTFKKKSTKRRFVMDEDKENTQTKKQQLQIDLMEIDKRTKSIQLYKLEKKYNLPPCEFTKEFHESIAENEEI